MGELLHESDLESLNVSVFSLFPHLVFAYLDGVNKVNTLEGISSSSFTDKHRFFS